MLKRTLEFILIKLKYLFLLLILIIPLASATINLKPGECKTFVLINSTEEICAQQIAENKISFSCPNVTLNVPSCPAFPTIPTCPKAPDNICTPSINVTSIAYDFFGQYYKDLKDQDETYYLYLFLIVLIVLIVLFIFKDEVMNKFRQRKQIQKVIKKAPAPNELIKDLIKKEDTNADTDLYN